MTDARDALRPESTGADSWWLGEHEIDRRAGVLRTGDRVVALRRQTWRLLCLLAEDPGRLWLKADLIATLWPHSVVVEDSLVQCIAELRRALGDASRSLIRTVPRRGYRLDAEIGSRGCLRRASSAGIAGADDAAAPLVAGWVALVRADTAADVEAARQSFAKCLDRPAWRGDAMAGIAMSHVIDVLNRWTCRPAWPMALAREASDEAFALDPASARACHARAHVALLEGRHIEAHLGFRAALSRDPAMSRARLRLGVIEMEMGHPERTGAHVREALAHADPTDDKLHAQARFIEGMALFHRGLDQEAAVCMRGVLALRPASGLAHQWLASIEALARRRQASVPHLAAFHRYVPGHTIDSLQATERSSEPAFVRQRRRLYDGLRLAGLD